MSNVEEGLFQVDANKQYGESIRAEIRDIHAFASYHSGWIDTDFLYERPRVILELDTKFGEIHADFELDDITDGNCFELLDALTDVSTGTVEMRDLLGEVVYLLPDEDYTKATVLPTDDPTRTYEKDHSVVLREPSRSPADLDEAHLGTEPRSIDWLNRLLRADYERHVESHHGWLERTIDEVESDGETVRVWVEVYADWHARWEFDDTFKGHLALHEFATDLGLPPDRDELEGSFVYLHPVRGLPHTIPRGDLPRDALERWVMAGDALDPTPPKQSFLDRLRSLLSPSPSPSVSVSTGRTRHAKSSDDYDVYDDCRSPSTSDEDAESREAVCVLSESPFDG